MNDTTLSERELGWVSAQGNRAQAIALVCYARMLNEREPAWLRDILRSDVTYGSQKVFETLEGYDDVFQGYLVPKMATLIRLNSPVRAELGVQRQLGPCVIVYQRDGDSLGIQQPTPGGLMTIKVDEDGRVSSLFMVTLVPEPDSAESSDIFPGVNPNDVWPPLRPILHVAGDYTGLKLVLVTLNGEIQLDVAMRESVAEVIDSFPGVAFETFSADTRTTTKEQIDRFNAWGVRGFPSLAVLWHDNLLMRIDGYLDSSAILRRIKARVG